MKDLLVLLTNDDGVEAPGLTAMRLVLARLGRVVTVAPAEERSATSHSLTIHQPIRITQVSDDCYSVSGTPVDCVLFALRKILPRYPDLVVSGINHGANLGDDILYSGTVAAAREASLHRLPSLAVSLVSGSRDDYQGAAAFVGRLIGEVYPDGIAEGTFLNVNIPNGQASSYRFTRQGNKRASGAILEKKDPRGRSYYWIGPDLSDWEIEADTDYQAIQEGLVSVTPLQRDQTDYRSLRRLHVTRSKASAKS